MENLLKTVKCIVCKHILQSPKVLPCGITMCEKHIIVVNSASKTTNSLRYYHCHSCGKNHVIPKNGFATNNSTNLLIELNLGHYKRALKSYESLQTTIDKFEKLKNEPISYINTTIGELKKRVHRKRDELIGEIRLYSEQIVSEFGSYESECHQSLGRLERTLVNVEMKLEKKKAKMVRLLDEMNRVEAADSEDRWRSIEARCDEEAKNLNSTMEQVKRFLLMNKFDEFKEKEVSFCQLSLFDTVDR